MFQDLAVTFSQRRWSCVVDPSLLLLTPFGPTLVQRLGELLELWVVRSFWGVLDGSYLYGQEPNRLIATGLSPEKGRADEGTVRQSLAAWERLRRRADLYGLRLRYIGDNYRQSALPERKEPDLVHRYEILSASLLKRLGANGLEPEKPGFEAREAVADVATLASTLHPTFILTFQDGSDDAPPSLCAILESWGFRCRRINEESLRDPLATIERDYVRSLLVHAGLSPLAWSGARLAVAHVLAPGTIGARTMLDAMYAKGEGDVGDYDEVLAEADEVRAAEMERSNWPDFWSGAIVFWYSL